YKSGMLSAYVKDNTPNSLTKNKKIIVPVTIIESPPLKILSVRLYKNGKVIKDLLSENLDKELKRKLKLPNKKEEKVEEALKKVEFDDIAIICYSLAKRTGIKKTPDICEIGLGGALENKISFVIEHLGKEINFQDFFKKNELIDIRGVTKGKGFEGPVKRFGIKLRQHKSEKGRRRPGSLGPWHPARVTFRVAMAGQTGFFTRVIYNSKIIEVGDVKSSKPSLTEKLKNINNFGDIRTGFAIIYGSVPGPAKRQIIVTRPLRKTKKQEKKSYELVELR
ncbi:MAG: 50S ribosomal protein L3, partial [Candidatus Pacearchaeota archaeon]